jgi:hypothetical protein
MLGGVRSSIFQLIGGARHLCSLYRPRSTSEWVPIRRISTLPRDLARFGQSPASACAGIMPDDPWLFEPDEFMRMLPIS